MPGNPFFDQTSDTGHAGAGYYGQDTVDPGSSTPGVGKGFFDKNGQWHARASTSAGTQRAQAIGQYSNYLMGRNGPNFNAPDTTNLYAARGNQAQALGLMRNAAMGNAPSVSQYQTYGQMGNNIAAMNAAANGGHTAAAMQGGSSLMDASAMGGANARAQEQAGYMGQYGQGASGLRGSDIGMYGQAQENLARGQGLASQQGILNANTVYGLQNQEQQAELNNESYQQATGQLEQQYRNQATQNLMTGAGVGLGLMSTIGMAAG